MKQYCCGESASAREQGDQVILEFRSEDESGEWIDEDPGHLSSLVPLRADIASGDLRALYLAWLACAQSGALDDAGADSPDVVGIAPTVEVERWVASLPEAEKISLLVRLIESDEPHLRAEIVRRFRESRTARAAVKLRTVGELLRGAEQRAEERRRREAEHAAREQARREQEAAEAREQYLAALAQREAEAWREVDALLATKQPGKYDAAVKLLKDLRDVAIHAGRQGEVEARLARLCEQHAKKLSFVGRLKAAGLKR